MDVNSSGWIFSWPDASQQQARCCRAARVRVKSLPQPAGKGAHMWTGHICLVQTACSLTLLPGQLRVSFTFLPFFFFFNYVLQYSSSVICTCNHLATKWVVTSSKLLAASPIYRKQQKLKQQNLQGCLAHLAAWCQLQRRWLTLCPLAVMSGI